MVERAGIKTLADFRANAETILYGVARAAAKKRMPDLVRVTVQTAKAEGKLIG